MIYDGKIHGASAALLICSDGKHNKKVHRNLRQSWYVSISRSIDQEET